MECDFFHDDVESRPGVLCLTLTNIGKKENENTHKRLHYCHYIRSLLFEFAVFKFHQHWNNLTSFIISQFHKMQHFFIYISGIQHPEMMIELLCARHLCYFGKA
jgi:hypothetical protein